MADLELTVASVDERDDLVVELTRGQGVHTEDVGLVTFDAASGKAMLDIYPRQSGGDWHFDLKDVRAVLERAQRRIMDVAGPVPREQKPASNEGLGPAVEEETSFPDAAPRARLGS